MPRILILHASMALGSVADKVVRGAGVPILIQRPAAEMAESDAIAQYTSAASVL